MSDIERLIERHKDAVYRQMVRVCGNREDAEDALADALVAAWKASGRLRDPASFQGWLARISKRACARIKVRGRLLKTVSLSELQQSGFDPIDNGTAGENPDLRKCVKGALDRLPPLYRDVYLEREITGVSADKVAKEMGLTVAAVKSRLYRARAMVRTYLDTTVGCTDF